MDWITRRRRRNIKPELTPLVDMVFILLVFFMLSASFLKPILKLSLPIAGQSSEASLAKVIIISADKTGQLYLEDSAISITDLMEKLKEIKRNTPQIELRFRGDSGLSYGAFVALVDQINTLGIEGLSLEHDPKK
jgi:biopolymer transport protein ExbD